MADQTLGFDERPKGWTSFYSFSPEWMLGLNNKFFSIKNGQLWVHDSQTADRNSFYGVAGTSRVSVMINEAPSEIKTFRTLEQEGTEAWTTAVQSYESDEDETKSGTITQSEYVEKEGRHHAHLRRNETETTEGQNVYGIGEVDSIASLVITVGAVPGELSVGDNVYRDNAGTGVLVGAVTATSSTTITLDSVAGLSTSDFIYGAKPTRVEGAHLRGYALRVDLENTSTSKRELYAVNSRIQKSNR